MVVPTGKTNLRGLAVESVAEDSPLAAVLARGLNVLHVSTPDRATVTSVAAPEELRAALETLAASGGFFIIGATGERDRWLAFPPLPQP